jgi:hypothetical protein
MAIYVRNLREGEADTLPPALQNTGMPYLVPEWVWIIETRDSPEPFAIVVTSFCHGWLVLWRLIAVSPLPPEIPLNWIKEAFPQVFAEARVRGCVGFLTLLADNRPEEAQIARIVTRMVGGTSLSFQGAMGCGLLPGIEEEDGKSQ